ncbi:helix-turn-helix transcriptional regulator [Capnocytophaga canimorsus]|nr:helix-turn-helix transcriptional regulator [Capnocytophaga canimorsus]WGU71645.1 helix-turn-helix transcriptional regulator [Capnocytophaga canimorsus]
MKNVELAKMIGVSNQQITNYHSGEKTPPLSTLEKIAKALNCEMAELLPLGDDFMHFYNEKGEWQGIIKKPVVANRGVSQEEEKNKLGITPSFFLLHRFHNKKYLQKGRF